MGVPSIKELIILSCSLTPNLQSTVGKAALDRVIRIQVDFISPSPTGTGIEKQAGLSDPHGQSMTAPVSSVF